MQHSTPTIINKHNKELYLFLLNAIMRNALWQKEGNANDIPNGIYLLRSKILAFEKRYKNLYDDLVVLNQLFEQCQMALSQSVLDADEAYDFAQLLYLIILESRTRKISGFERSLDSHNDADLNKKNYELFKCSDLNSRKEFAREFTAFKKNIRKKWGAKPEIFYVQDYLFSHHYNNDDIDHRKSFYIGGIANGYAQIAGYVDSIINNSYLFMKFFGTPESLAWCTKVENYYLIAYDQSFSIVNYQQSDVDRIQIRYHLLNVFRGITTNIMRAALDDKHFDLIFRSLKDVLAFLNLKAKQNTHINYGLEDAEQWRNILAILVSKLLESPRFLVLLNNDLRTNNGVMLREIQKHISDVVQLESAVRGKMTHYNSFMGLFSSSGKGGLPIIPKDVIRTITTHAEQSIHDDHEKSRQIKKK